MPTSSPDRTFSFREVAALIPELRRYNANKPHRDRRFLSDTARQHSGSGNYRRYTANDVAVLRAACDIAPVLIGGPLRSAILRAISDGERFPIRVGPLSVDYEPRWLSLDEVAAMDADEAMVS